MAMDDKLAFLRNINLLKHMKRRGWVLKDIPDPEPIAGHMYRMSIIALFLLDEAKSVDLDKVMKLSLVHDIAECKVGDIVPADNIDPDEKHRREMAAIHELACLLPGSSAETLQALWKEYEDRLTPEAKLCKDLDRFDMVHQAYEYLTSEYERTGKICDLDEFFAQTVTGSIENPQIAELTKAILVKRQEFLDSIAKN